MCGSDVDWSEASEDDSTDRQVLSLDLSALGTKDPSSGPPCPTEPSSLRPDAPVFWPSTINLTSDTHIFSASASSAPCDVNSEGESKDRSTAFDASTARKADGKSQFTSATQARLERIRKEHNLAKAVKPDKAPVPEHLWSDRIFRGPEGIPPGDRGWEYGLPTTDQIKCLIPIRRGALRYYRRKVLQDCLYYLRKTHGANWPEKRKKSGSKRKSRLGGATSLELNLESMREIVWRVWENSWFEYPAGSSLFYFRFPRKYRALARDGVPIFVKSELPSTIKPQPHSPPEARAVLQDKLPKMIERRYIGDPDGLLQALIFYFTVPKGVLDGVIQDWRIVYDAGANGLNDAVWAPSFWMPTISSLIRLLDNTSWMEDRDLGEMFINFPLHRSVRR